MSKLILLSDDDYEFLVGFDPDRDRTASRAQMVDVLHDVQSAVREGLLLNVIAEQIPEDRLSNEALPGTHCQSCDGHSCPDVG